MNKLILITALLLMACAGAVAMVEVIKNPREVLLADPAPPGHKWYISMMCGTEQCEILNCSTETSPAIEYEAAVRQDGKEDAAITDDHYGGVVVSGGTIVQNFFSTELACRRDIAKYEAAERADAERISRYK